VIYVGLAVVSDCDDGRWQIYFQPIGL